MAPFSSRLSDAMIGDPDGLALLALTARDVPLVERLMREAEVALWWPDFDAGDLIDKIGSDHVTPFRIACGETIGYAQIYHANSDPFWTAFGVPRETFGLDLSIGHPAYRGRGVGRAAARLLIDRLIAWPQVVRVQIDPDPANERAVRAYRGAGFVPRGVHPGYDGGSMLYMTVER